MKTKQIYSRTYLIIGIIIALGFAIIYNYKSKSKKQEIASNIEHSNDNIDTISGQKKDTVIIKDTTVKKIKTKKKLISKKPKRKINKDTFLINDSSLNNYTPTDSINTDTTHITDSIIIDSMYSNNSTDSLIIYEDDSIEYKILEIETNNNEINIAQDELIYANMIYPKGDKNNFACSTNSEYDSILVNNVVRSTKDGLYVEFWRSAINSTGYKLSQNTLVLYGFYEYKNIELRYLENGFIELKYKNNTLLLQCNDNFTPLHIEK